jgi:Flp pilus assembly protein TadB
MRISNTERNEIADILSKHFAEGRLDSDEFEERVGKVMSAKTRGDLAGLLDDLPRLGPPPREPRRRRPIGYWILVLVLALFVASALAIPPHVHVPWLLIGIVALVLWRKTRHRNRWHRHDVVSPG